MIKNGVTFSMRECQMLLGLLKNYDSLAQLTKLAQEQVNLLISDLKSVVQEDTPEVAEMRQRFF